MTDKIIPLIYIFALGFLAFRLCNMSFPDSAKLGPRHYAFFVILNITGFIVTALLPAPYTLFVLVTVFSIVLLTPVEPVPRIAMFLFLVPIMPNLDFDFYIGIPLMWMTWPRLLTIVILLPLLLRAFRHKSAFYYPVDKYIWAFFLFNAVLAFRDTSITNGLRGVTYLTIDMLAPYFVISRYVKSFADIRTVLFGLLGALVFTGLVNVFETARHWHVYEQLMVNVTGARFMAIERLGLLRATGPFGIPSQAGFAMATGLGLCWALAPYLRRRVVVIGIVTILATGLFVTFSRGNWIAGLIVGLGYLFTVNRKQFFRAGALLVIIAIPLSSLDIADDIMRIMPFVGAEDSEAAETVSYRAALLDTSIKVANENPWFGSATFHEHPDMEELRQASGLLDLVNHYLIVLLSTGYTGLALFFSIMLSTLATLLGALRRSADQAADHRTLCQAILFSFIGMLVAITTTSALGRVGLIIWCMVAVTAAAARMMAKAHVPARRQTAGNQRSNVSGEAI